MRFVLCTSWPQASTPCSKLYRCSEQQQTGRGRTNWQGWVFDAKLKSSGLRCLPSAIPGPIDAIIGLIRYFSFLACAPIVWYIF